MAEKQPSAQRRFSVMGDNTFLIANKLMSSKKLCRLLKYQVRDPLNQEKYPDVNGADLINKQILIIPKVFDDSTEKMSYVAAIFSGFVVNAVNPEFKQTTIRFDIACPYEEWLLDDRTLRPYLIMQEIDTLFNGAQMAGIGTLQFYRAENLTLTPWIGGFSMFYKIDEFN